MGFINTYSRSFYFKYQVHEKDNIFTGYYSNGVYFL